MTGRSPMSNAQIERMKHLLREALAKLDAPSDDEMLAGDHGVKNPFKDEPKPSRSKHSYKLRFDIELEDYIVEDDDDDGDAV